MATLYGMEFQSDLDEQRKAELALEEYRTTAALGRPADAEALAGALESALALVADYHQRWRGAEDGFEETLQESVKDLRAALTEEKDAVRETMRRRLESLRYLLTSQARNAERLRRKTADLFAGDIARWARETAHAIDPAG